MRWVYRGRLAAALTILMVGAPVLAGAQSDSIRIGKKGQIELTQATRLGATLLAPGHYDVRHTVIDGEHYVITRHLLMPTRRHRAFVAGPEVARVRCQLVALDKPPRWSTVSWTTGPDGPVITEIRIADEPAGHLALQPAAGW